MFRVERCQIQEEEEEVRINYLIYDLYLILLDEISFSNYHIRN